VQYKKEEKQPHREQEKDNKPGACIYPLHGFHLLPLF
jgi:hypothetical protein